nr:clathrin light chain-like isoform X2 [Cherax quadricarinatus]
MDGFGDSFVPLVEGSAPAAEVDPAAEFLAREQDQLAGLGDDILPATLGQDQSTVASEKAAPPPPSVFGSVDFLPQPSGEDPWASAQAPCATDESVAQPVEETLGFTESLSSQSFTIGEGEGFLPSSDLAGAAAAEAPASDAVTAEVAAAKTGTAPERRYSGFGSDFGGASVPAGDTGTTSGAFSFTGDPAPPVTTSEPDLARSPIPHVVREDPEKIKIWREQQRIRLEQKDAAEEVSKIELKEKARKELEDWYKQHEEQVAKTRQANREASKSAEKELVADTAKMEPGTEWERITKLCNFNPKTSKSSRDISRMRSIILQVKQNPPIKA